MEKQERRKHPRCHEDTGIFYSFLNKSDRHAAVARNYSGFGMYFEADTPLVPDTIIVIRPLDCHAPGDPDTESFAKGPAPYYCRNSGLSGGTCRELKLLVTAQVKRCEKIDDTPEYYGIGVRFIEPAI
jgi:hypothetical protein